jgi:DNA-binding MurR/RpiR family transcriptional regulator
LHDAERKCIVQYMSLPAPETSSIAVRLRDALAALPRGERSVARALLNAYPIAGLGTLAELAARSGVSTPTVLRLLLRLGFEGYSDFQRALHIELSERLANVYEDYRGDGFDERSIGAASLAQAAVALEGTARGFTEDEFAAAVRLLADSRLAVYAMGGAFSQSLALLLALHLGVLRPRVQSLPCGSAELSGALAQSGRRDVLVVYDFRRYSEATLAVARHVAERGGRIVLVTDRWLSPVAPYAESVLVARTESVSPFDSLTAATALTEALVAGVSALLGTDGRARAEAIARLDHAIAKEPRGALEARRGEDAR